MAKGDASKICLEICKGQCCKNLTQNDISITLTKSEIELYEKKGYQNFIIYDADEVELIKTSTGNCPFLLKSNQCSIYLIRPQDCQEYPYIFESKEQVNKVAKCILYENLDFKDRLDYLKPILLNQPEEDRIKTKGTFKYNEQIDPNKFDLHILSFPTGLISIYKSKNGSTSLIEIKNSIKSELLRKTKSTNFIILSLKGINKNLELEYIATGYYYRKKYFDKINSNDPPDLTLTLLDFNKTDKEKIDVINNINDIKLLTEIGAYLLQVLKISIDFVYKKPEVQEMLKNYASDQLEKTITKLPTKKELQIDNLALMNEIARRFFILKDKKKLLDGVVFDINESVINGTI
ncbi:MAG: YkgJ family cysteine cluster protein [Candidatus Heimdallarchaeota archaeon]|nr:YkgJ family cysteine cluster protein [Candidatus Heimdallarchaeota archaeon]